MRSVKVWAIAVVLAITSAVAIKTVECRNVEVAAASYNIPGQPVYALVPEKAGNCVVRDCVTNKIVPSQVEREGVNLKVTWIAADPAKPYSVEFVGAPQPAELGGVNVSKNADAVEVLINRQLFTRYVFANTPKPYCHPVIGPAGLPVTRAFPMATVPGETKDHPHHRSLWFTFGDVNGIDFWAETEKSGKIVHRKFEKLKSGPVYGQIVSVNDWIGPDGNKVCEDRQDLRIYRTDVGRLMDFEVTVKATEGPLEFGDTKEGMFGVRVATSMDVHKGGKGEILNSRGDRNDDAWGKQAEWCDYYGPVDGRTVGIAIMDHPTSFRSPTHWHVRTYGLFAANPFGLSDFTKGEMNGSHSLPEGGSVTFKYRIFIHEGSTEEARVAEVYSAYARGSKANIR